MTLDELVESMMRAQWDGAPSDAELRLPLLARACAPDSEMLPVVREAFGVAVRVLDRSGLLRCELD